MASVLTVVAAGALRRTCGPAGRARVQAYRCDGQQRRAARPERLEEPGQYGWWPALDGEGYRARLKTFSVRTVIPAAPCVSETTAVSLP
jgi:hypothetical protein